jgi:colicin import membrane protein
MDSKKRFSWPIILALALHITILGLFALSALLKPDKKEPEPAPEIRLRLQLSR